MESNLLDAAYLAASANLVENGEGRTWDDTSCNVTRTDAGKEAQQHAVSAGSLAQLC